MSTQEFYPWKTWKIFDWKKEIVFLSSLLIKRAEMQIWIDTSGQLVATMNDGFNVQIIYGVRLTADVANIQN